MSIVKHAIITAAGLGSRLELNSPKCLVDVGGRRVIDYQLDLLKEIEGIRVVVGFMENEVIEYVHKIRPDAIFVRNPDFKTTTNSYSLNLGSYDLNEPFLSIDGDVIIEPQSFRNFLSKCDGQSSVVGVTKTKTEEAVFAHLNESGEKIEKFSFEEKSLFEWSGIAYLKDIKIQRNAGFVCREIERYLPLPAQQIECYEIDTPEDLNNAIEMIDSFGY